MITNSVVHFSLKSDYKHKPDFWWTKLLKVITHYLKYV